MSMEIALAVKEYLKKNEKNYDHYIYILNTDGNVKDTCTLNGNR